MSPPMDREALEKLTLATCPLPIYRVPLELELKSACEALQKEPILGFDTETKPAFRRGESYPPSLMQLATSGAVYLIQLSLLKKLKPLQDLLESPNLKVGVGINEDLRRLIPYFNLKAKGRCAQFIDLTILARSKGLEVGSLRGLTAELLERRLSKSAQLTNWANPHLTYAQLRYAALDAWASREIFLKLEGK